MCFKMIGINKKHITERLYLDREGEEDIYIDTCPLPQHQIDGIRFLFRQFKKGKPGVILNNPEGYGKTVQVALFLDAVQKLLQDPVLILCKDDKELENWIKTFKSWTKYTADDIAVDSTNVYIKKSIFLKRGTHAVPPYSRRDWGVVVMANDFIPRELMKLPINATYKIWLTTMDMRKDLQMLSSIYSWLYSKKKFNINNFIDSLTNSKAPLERLKLLHAFMEDVVIIRNDFTPLKIQEITQEEPITIAPKVTRKNKDATGTKIKRSKKKIEEIENSSENKPGMSVDISSKSNSSTSNMYIDAQKTKEDIRIDDCIDNNNFKDKDNMDIESFIRDKKPVECKEYEFITDTNSVDSEGFSFAEAVRDIVINENDALGDDTEQNSKCDLGNADDIKTSHTSEISKVIDGKTFNGNSNNANDKDQSKNNTSPLSSINVSITEMKHDLNKDNICKKDDIIVLDDRHEIDCKKKENKRDLDYKISELEEKAMKKFKGSLLDSFF